MTSINPASTSFLHNIRLDDSKQQSIDFDKLFTDKNISSERFEQLNLASTFDNLETFALNNDGESMEILCNLTARNDEIGKAATSVLTNIRNLSEEKTHRRELLDSMCNDLYENCRNNEANNRSPQVHQLTTGMLEVILDIKLSTEYELSNETQNLLHLLHQKNTQNSGSSVVLTEDSMLSNVELSKQEVLQTQKQVLSKPSSLTLENLELFSSQTENKQFSLQERLEKAFGPITASQTEYSSTSNETVSTPLSSLSTTSIKPKQQIDVQSNISGSLMEAPYIDDTQSQISKTSFMSGSSIGSETTSSSFQTMSNLRSNSPLDIQSQNSQSTQYSLHSDEKVILDDNQVLGLTPQSPNNRGSISTTSHSSTEKDESVFNSHQKNNSSQEVKLPLDKSQSQVTSTDNQSKVTWYNPFSLAAAGLNWSVGRGFQDGRQS
ncbi:hypothetical protein [uncultured Shewanella sp.]|uniref:hypothetical protein n=1 Tax=uncultured Shewanella sp. TaxID=173975 RepID=UPI0026109769|nr:hypothetical protein [uncultured Shewanella sp.]